MWGGAGWEIRGTGACLHRLEDGCNLAALQHWVVALVAHSAQLCGEEREGDVEGEAGLGGGGAGRRHGGAVWGGMHGRRGGARGPAGSAAPGGHPGCGVDPRAPDVPSIMMWGSRMGLSALLFAMHLQAGGGQAGRRRLWQRRQCALEAATENAGSKQQVIFASLLRSCTCRDVQGSVVRQGRAGA